MMQTHKHQQEASRMHWFLQCSQLENSEMQGLFSVRENTDLATELLLIRRLVWRRRLQRRWAMFRCFVPGPFGT